MKLYYVAMILHECNVVLDLWEKCNKREEK